MLILISKCLHRYYYAGKGGSAVTKSIALKGPHNSEKTTEGILKAARLGDLKMLAELYREGIFWFTTESLIMCLTKIKRVAF